MPVLEALDDTALRVDKVILAEGLRGEPVRAILAAARARGVRVERASAHRVKVLAGNGRHDQGVLADVVAPRMEPVDEFLARLGDGPRGRAGAGPAHQPGERRHDPAQRHRGRARRRAAPPPRAARDRPAGGQGVGRGGVPGAGAAGGTVEEGCAALRGGGFAVYGLDAGGSSLLDAELPARVALVLGNETDGLSASVRAAAATGCWRSRCTAGSSRSRGERGRVAAFELLRGAAVDGGAAPRRVRPVCGRHVLRVQSGSMGIGDFANKAKDFADQHDEQVDQGLDRAGDVANERFAGHEGQIDGVGGPGAAVHRRRRHHGRRRRHAAEVPGGPQTDVPAATGNVPPQQ